MRAAEPHVLIVPSWYPNPRTPHSGVFVREQARAAHIFAADLSLSVWNWCPGQYRASFKRPCEALRLLRAWRTRPQPHWIIDEVSGLREYVNPVFESPRPFSLTSRRLVRGLREAIDVIAKTRGPIDLIHAHVALPAGWAAVQVGRELNIPLVLTEHMGPQLIAELNGKGAPYRRWRSAHRAADSIVAVSQSQADLIRRHTERSATIIPNVVDETAFSPASHPLPADSPFLTVGSLRPVKGTAQLLRCYARALKLATLPTLRIVGEGPLRRQLEQAVQALGLADRVQFLGRLSPAAVADEMRRCAALIVSSQSESFSVTTIEAMASGRPVLSTKCGGPEEIISESTGMLVANGDDGALAHGLVLMARRWAEYDPIRIREDAVARFGRAAIAGKLRDHYHSVLASRT